MEVTQGRTHKNKIQAPCLPPLKKTTHLDIILTMEVNLVLKTSHTHTHSPNQTLQPHAE